MQYKNEKTLHLIKIFGKTLQKIRQEKVKKSQTMLAYEFDLDSGNLSRIENGKTDPKLTMIWRVSEAIGVAPSEIFKIIENELGSNFHVVDI